MRFVDTNVLLYSISLDPKEAAKRERAIQVLEEENLSLSVQVLQEFYFQATRSNRPHPLSHRDALDLIKSWQRFPVQENTLEVLDRALDLKGSHSFSVWDCTIVAAALSLGCTALLTEDMQHGRTIAGLRIHNPFLGLG